MENLLDVDLNDFVTKKVTKKIKSLEKQLKDSNDKNYDLYNQINNLKKEVDASKITLTLLHYLRDEFAKIKCGESDSGGWYDSKEKNQFVFIKKILLNVFNIKEEYGGWKSCRSYGTLGLYLAINYYNHKEVLINLIKTLIPDYFKIVSVIESFKMPYDYTKDEVISYVENPLYNTNGCIFGGSEYWVESGATLKTNMPHDLIMKNPHILEDDVFEMLLETIYKRSSHYYYLFALPEYNKNISDKQIILLGEALIDLGKNVLEYDNVKKFINDNIKKFSNRTLDFLFQFIQYENNYGMFYWATFPNEYQMKFLFDKKLNEVLRILNNCTWSLEEKENFLKRYVTEIIK